MRAKRLPALDFYVQRIKEQNFHKHPLAIPVAAFLLLAFVLLVGFAIFNDTSTRASNSNVVIVTHDKKREIVPTKAATVGEFLSKAGIVINEGDVVEPGQETPIEEDNFRVNVYRARPVMVVDGTDKKFAFSAATTPRSVATQAGTEVYPEDRVTSEMQTDFLKDGAIGEKVVIVRAKPTYLNLYGVPVVVRTHAKTVEELLKEKNIQLASGDTVQPDAKTSLTPQTQVFVTRSGTKIQTVEETIAMQTEVIEDPTLSFGTTVTRQKGSAGKKLVTYQVDLVNNKETGRHVIQTVVVQEPVKQITARGKAINIPADKEAVMAAAGIAPGDYPYVNYIVSRESGWNAASRNASSGAYGLCQALPGSKMVSAGGDWATNPVTQLRWCSGYARDRYGSWAGAYNFWLSHHYW
jgi:resuscitation-promoting factor RpfB